MITIPCPICEEEIEITFAADEDWAHRPTAEVDEIKQSCSCNLNRDQVIQVCAQAIRVLEDVDPPGDY